MKALILAVLVTSALIAAPQAQAAGDLSGLWIVAGGGGSGGGGGGGAYDKNPESEWSASKLPFTARGRAAFEANHPGKGPRLFPIPQRNDPLTQGNPPGLHRTLVYARPMEFVAAPGNRLIQTFEWSRVWRTIYLDGRPAPKDLPAGPYWYGYSVGRWEGDTLVVTVVGLDSRAWLDEWGTPFTDDARIEEWWRRVAPNRLELKIKVTDPAYYTTPWTSSAIVFEPERKGVDMLEVIHAPMDEAAFDQLIVQPAGKGGGGSPVK